MSSRCPTVEARRKKILIVKYGSFSHVNGKVEAMLREQFPEHDPVVIDVVLDILSGHLLGSLYLRIKATLPRIGSILRGKNSPWDFVFADPMAWKLISQENNLLWELSCRQKRTEPANICLQVSVRLRRKL